MRLVHLSFVFVSLVVLCSAPVAEASGGIGVEIYYYNYGATWPSGQEIEDCYGWEYESGDRTPHHGELKVVITTICSTYDESIQWWRYQENCVGGDWYMISSPYWSNDLVC